MRTNRTGEMRKSKNRHDLSNAGGILSMYDIIGALAKNLQAKINRCLPRSG